MIGKAERVANKVADQLRQVEARLSELEAGIREYLGEYDTPAKDYAYRAACREKLRKLVSQ